MHIVHYLDQQYTYTEPYLGRFEAILKKAKEAKDKKIIDACESDIKEVKNALSNIATAKYHYKDMYNNWSDYQKSNTSSYDDDDE